MFKFWVLSCYLFVASSYAVVTKDCPKTINAKFNNLEVISAKDLETSVAEAAGLEAGRKLVESQKEPFETTVNRYQTKHGQCLYRNEKFEFVRLFTTESIDKQTKKKVKTNHLHASFPLKVKALNRPTVQFWIDIIDYKDKLTSASEDAEVNLVQPDEQYEEVTYLGSTRTFSLSLSN